MSGGAFDDTDDTLVIHAPSWQSHETVTVRYIPTAQDESWVHNQLIKYQQERKQQATRSLQRNTASTVENHTGEAKLLWVERMLVSWTLTKNNIPMPVSRAAVRAMKLSYIDYIYDEIMKHQEPFGQTEEEAQDFTTPASTIIGEAEESDEEEQEPTMTISAKNKADRNYLLKS